MPLSATTVDEARRIISVIQACNESASESEALAGFMDNFLEIPIEVILFRPKSNDNLMTAIFFGSTSRIWYVFFGGLLTAGSTYDHALQASVPWGTGGVDGVNSYSQQQAAVAFTAIRDHPAFDVNDKFVLGGHSGGGAAIQALAIRLHETWLGTIVVHSFGSPKLGNERAREAVQGFPNYRWMSQADPVPHLPPDGRSMPLLLIAAPAGVRGSWVNHVQTNTGWVVANDGRLLPLDLPPDAGGVTLTWSVGKWLTAFATGAENVHSSRWYIDKLRLALAVMPPEEFLDLPDLPDFIPPSVINNAMQAKLDLLARADTPVAMIPDWAWRPNQRQEIHNVPTVGGSVTVLQRVEQPLKIYRSNRQWVVSFKGLTFCQTPHKKLARRCFRKAKSMIALLSSLEEGEARKLVGALADGVLYE